MLFLSLYHKFLQDAKIMDEKTRNNRIDSGPSPERHTKNSPKRHTKNSPERHTKNSPERHTKNSPERHTKNSPKKQLLAVVLNLFQKPY